MMGRGKLGNEYARAFGRLYAKTPKAVFAALVYSYYSGGGDFPDSVLPCFLAEWETLHANGILPQSAPTARTKRRTTAGTVQPTAQELFEAGKKVIAEQRRKG